MFFKIPSKQDVIQATTSSAQLLEEAKALKDTYLQADESAQVSLASMKLPIVTEELNASFEPEYYYGNMKTYEFIRDHTDIIIDPHDPASIPLVYKLYLEKNHSESILLLKEIDHYIERESLDSRIASVNRDLKGLFRFLYFFFKKSRKEKVLHDLNTLQAFQEDYNGKIEALKKWQAEVSTLSSPELITDFSGEEEAYYETLSNLYGIHKSQVTKQDYEDLKTFQKEIEDLSGKLQALIDFHAGIRKQAMDAIADVKKADVQRHFQETTLHEFDEMYPDIIPNINHLRSLGILTVDDLALYLGSGLYDTFFYSTNTLEQRLIQYKQALRDTLPVQFDLSSKNSAETKLLKALYYYVNEKSFMDDLMAMSAEYADSSLTAEVQTVKRINTYWQAQQVAKDHDAAQAFKKASQRVSSFLDQYQEELVTLTDTMNELSFPVKEEVWEDFSQKAASYYAVLDKHFDTGTQAADQALQNTKLSQRILKQIEEFQLNEKGLNSVLRSWQDFGAKYALVQKKVLIGDEMGLGKTLISIAVMSHLATEKGKGKFLVVCPASIMENWMREVVKHSQLVPYQIHGTGRNAVLAEWEEKGGVGITTYETASKLGFTYADFFDVLTVDEAHYAKSPKAKRSKNVYHLTDRSDYAIYLTGTPLENRPEEMTNLIHALQPELARQVRIPNIHERPEVYRKEIAPVYLRRTKQDVRLELPPLTQIEEWEEFGKKELENYREAVREGHFMRMRRMAWSGGSPNNSPKLYRLKEICEEAAENGQKVIVFSFFKDVLRTIAHNLPKQVIGVIDGDMPIPQRQTLIDKFRVSTKQNVLVAQINTAAHGLNLQFANIVIFCEPQIKPSLETQAAARAYRMGQTQNVFVYRLLTPASVDESMMDMLGNKQQLFDTYADKSYLHEEASIQEEVVKKEESLKQQIIDKEQKRLGISPVDKGLKQLDTGEYAAAGPILSTEF